MRVSDEGRRVGWVKEERGKDVIKKSNEEVREIKFREERESIIKKMIKFYNLWTVPSQNCDSAVHLCQKF